jgi:hypothetical protein
MVKGMAYLRREQDATEIGYSLDKVWTAIRKVLSNLEWNIEQIDNIGHQIKAKTKGYLVSWGSVLIIAAVPIDEKTTRVSIAAESPVTTITAMIDFGRTRHIISLFFAELAKQLAS